MHGRATPMCDREIADPQLGRGLRQRGQMEGILEGIHAVSAQAIADHTAASKAAARATRDKLLLARSRGWVQDDMMLSHNMGAHGSPSKASPR